MPDVPQEPHAILADTRLRAQVQKARMAGLRNDLERHSKADPVGVSLCRDVESAFEAVLRAIEERPISAGGQEVPERIQDD